MVSNLSIASFKVKMEYQGLDFDGENYPILRGKGRNGKSI